MNERTRNILFVLLRAAVCGDPLPDGSGELLTEEALPPLYELAKRHDMAHLIGYVLAEQALLEQDNPYYGKFYQQYMTAIYRYMQMNNELERLCEALEQAELPFVPLKGFVLRQYYPEPWMRTSCDIDILVHKQQLEKAKACLEERLSYQITGETSHDVSFFSPGGVHVELHYQLIEERLSKKSARVLEKIWADALPKSGYRYWQEMSDAMFYFYHIAHMAKHFENGGCGIRPFLDLWILEHNVTHDDPCRNALISEGGLLTFANAARQLASVWFENAPHAGITGEMEQYILYGGVYGTAKTRIAVQQNKKGGKLGYILSRAFLPYDSIKRLYPVLERHKWLTPWCEVRRWFGLLRREKAQRMVRELSTNQALSKRDVEITARMLKELEL